MSRLCCAGPPFEPFDGGLKRITTDRATGACRGSRGHWPGFSPAGMLKDGVFPSPNRPQSLHSLNLMSEPHLPSGPELCPKPAPGFCSRCRKSFSGSFGLAICPTCGDRLIPEGYCPVCEDYWAASCRRTLPQARSAARRSGAAQAPVRGPGEARPLGHGLPFYRFAGRPGSAHPAGSRRYSHVRGR